MFFLTGGVGLENTRENPAKEWLPEKSWDELCRMSDLEAFDGFLESFEGNLEQWNNVYDSAQAGFQIIACWRSQPMKSRSGRCQPIRVS